MITRFASRKFLLAVAALGSAHWLCASGHIAEGVYSAVVIACVGGYLAANVTQKVTAKEPAP
jgi:fructose-1,6-bisphosphatase/sedoheptulose 1,7-bisphosphatase-like protein